MDYNDLDVIRKEVNEKLREKTSELPNVGCRECDVIYVYNCADTCYSGCGVVSTLRGC